MKKKKILFICGSLNQTTIMYKIYQHLKDYDAYFTPYYGDGFVQYLAENGLLDFTILGGRARQRTERFFTEKKLNMDYGGKKFNYDLVVACQDLFVPDNIKDKNIVLVQEGMTVPENVVYHLVKNLNLPRYLANTSMTGLSDNYHKFCVASDGFKELFIKKGVNPEKLIVTGIPNFDDVKKYKNNNFPHKSYVLAATSHLRETYKYEDRKGFIRKVKSIANGKEVIFKLHPNEKFDRAIREIKKYAPDSHIYTEGNTNHMIANCDSLVTKYSSVVLIAQALGKLVYSDLDANLLKRLSPVQNDGRSAKNIAAVCKKYLA